MNPHKFRPLEIEERESIIPQLKLVSDLCEVFALTISRSDIGRNVKSDYRLAINDLRQHAGDMKMEEFALWKLAAMQKHYLAAARWTNCQVANRWAGRIAKLFCWAADQGMFPMNIAMGLCELPSLMPGHHGLGAGSTAGISATAVEKTIPHLSAHVQAMIGLLQVAPLRAVEVAHMQVGDINRSDDDRWIYRIRCDWRRGKEIHLSATARHILFPFLTTNPADYVFRPADAFAALYRRRRDQAKGDIRRLESSVRCKRMRGQLAGQQQKQELRPCYSPRSLTAAIAVACDVADEQAHRDEPEVPANIRIVPRWSVIQLRFKDRI
jgi:hypothetical protein